jgi:hypothetical protein
VDAAALPAATTTVAGAVQLADAAAITAGTATRVVDAAQLKAAVAAEDLWDRTGTEITTKTAGDKVFVGGDVKVGGTTGAPNITLSAGGAGTFNDRLTVRKLVNPDYTANIWHQGGGNPSLAGYTLYLSSGEPGSPSSATRLGFGASGIVDNAAITLMGDYVTPFFGFTHGISIGGTLPSAPNITLGADGNAGFGVIPATLAGFGRTVRVKGAGASGVIAEGVNGDTWLEMYSGLTAADGTAVIYPSTGTLRFATTTSVGTTGFSEKARLTSTGDFLLGGTLPSAPNITLKANGGGYFADKVGIGTAPLADVHIKTPAGNTELRVESFLTPIVSLNGGPGSEPLIAYGPDGLRFGSVTGAGTTGLTNRALLNKTGDLLLGGTLPSAPNITLKADGGAGFAGTVDVGVPLTDGTGIKLNRLGEVIVYRDAAAPANAGMFTAQHGTAITSTLTAEGSLLLGGTLPSAPNITLKADGNINAKGAVARVYADNAAAKAGGLVDGDIYRTATGQLMIVFT